MIRRIAGSVEPCGLRSQGLKARNLARNPALWATQMWSGLCHHNNVAMAPGCGKGEVQRVEPRCLPLPDWSPQLPMEVLHPVAPPVDKCYAPSRFCELTQATAVGGACSCQTVDGRVRGQ